MTNWKDIVITPETLILQAMKVIDTSALQIALVVDSEYRLIGTVTDGDIRRGILKGLSMNEPVSSIMNTKPTVAKMDASPEEILFIMQTKSLMQIPIVDRDGRLVGLERINSFIRPKKRENIIVLMAGGLGTRLQPLTHDCPKPLLRVGAKPILETILESFIQFGFYRFYISVNYKAEMIREYFGDGSKWGIEIKYLHESERLGTAGALSLLPELPERPLIVMNGDLLTKVNFKHLLEFHEKHQSMATMCIREYKVQVPYGVVKVDEQRLLGIEEKPTYNFFVSAGIYVIQPEILHYIPKNTFFDMPSLFEMLARDGMNPSVFPIREYWLDIGRMGDYEQANIEYKEVFR